MQLFAFLFMFIRVCVDLHELELLSDGLVCFINALKLLHNWIKYSLSHQVSLYYIDFSLYYTENTIKIRWGKKLSSLLGRFDCVYFTRC